MVEKKFRGILAKPLVGRQLLSLMLVAASETTRVLVSPTTSFLGKFPSSCLRTSALPQDKLSSKWWYQFSSYPRNSPKAFQWRDGSHSNAGRALNPNKTFQRALSKASGQKVGVSKVWV